VREGEDEKTCVVVNTRDSTPFHVNTTLYVYARLACSETSARYPYPRPKRGVRQGEDNAQEGRGGWMEEGRKGGREKERKGKGLPSSPQELPQSALQSRSSPGRWLRRA